MNLTFPQALRDLEARGFGIRADLGRIEALVELLDHPERTYPALHVSGTNGKTSTARIGGSILAAHGINCGVYTSPHLIGVRERFSSVGVGSDGLLTEPITEDEFADLYSYLLPFIEIVENDRGEQVTYFEATTALAFEWMAQKPVGVGIFEVGMGGKWDATNVVNAATCVLTTIALDHQAFLGDTPLENAVEKVGIITDGAEVISGVQDPDVLALIESTCKERGASLSLFDRDFKIASDIAEPGGRLVTVEGTAASYPELSLPLRGAHQARNLAIALVACESLLGRELDQDSLKVGLDNVSSPGRLEVVSEHPLVVLDGAHNPDAARTLGSALQESFPGRRRKFVIAIFDDKDVRGILQEVLPFADEVTFTRIEEQRPSADPAELRSIAEESGFKAKVVEPMAKALDNLFGAATEEDMIVVTGSIHGVGEAAKHVRRSLQTE